MASNSKLVIAKHLVWITDKPYENYPRISTAFVVKNKLYTLSLNFEVDSYNRKLYLYRLKIRDKSGKIDSNLPCDVSVCMLNESGRYEYLNQYKEGSLQSCYMWSQYISEIIKHFSDFHEKRLVRFKITFYCNPGSLHLLSGTGDKAVQTLCSTADKSVQTLCGTADKSVQTLCGTADKNIQMPTYLNNYRCLESLSLDFSSLLGDKKNTPTDVELKCGSYTVQAHKSILSARSEVFAAMLQCDMLEGKTGQVDVKDIDADVFREFIQYLYSGTVSELTVDKASAFYKAGDKYAVRALVRRCSSFLVENIRPENSCDLLVIADAHSDQEFKDIVMSYILDKKIPLDEEHWPVLCIEHPTLANEVLSRGFKLYCPK